MKRFFQVHIKSSFIMNGVCVRWRGWIDLERLEGIGCLEFNEDRAAIEDNILREQIQRYNERLRDYEDKQRGYRQQDRTEQDLDVSAGLGRGNADTWCSAAKRPPMMTKNSGTVHLGAGASDRRIAVD